jgi:predicted dinucleotide-binding enzyme
MAGLRIVVFGTGDMGAAIATALSERTDHFISVRGSRLGSASAKSLADLLGIEEATDAEIENSDVAFAVLPPQAIPAVLPTLRNFRGVLVSVVVSRTVARDGLPSSAEQMAEMLPSSRVVNAFTSMWSNVVRNPGVAEKPSAFVCSDHDDAKALVSGLAVELGFEAVDGGKLSSAIYTEAMGMFAVRLALDSGYGQTISFRAFRATEKLS